MGERQLIRLTNRLGLIDADRLRPKFYDYLK